MFGVIGAGKMGIQLTKLLSSNDNAVLVVRDIKKARSAYIARYPNRTENTHNSNHLDRIVFTESLDELKDCEIVFECLPEILDLKLGNKKNKIPIIKPMIINNTIIKFSFDIIKNKSKESKINAK